MEVKDIDTWKQAVQKDIEEIKSEQSGIKSDIRRLQDNQLLHDQEIKSFRETLKEIKDDTKWLRRAITNAIIAALIGGAVAIFYAAIKNI